MRVALTFNLKRGTTEHEAEFDTEETIAYVASLLADVGHVVVPVEVSCSIETLVRRLRRAGPDVVFNLAEGRRGPFREALYPAVFEELGLPYTGSSASVLALCMDKSLANRVVAASGVRVPGGRLVRAARDLADIHPPVIVKPNFEGSSKGISQASVVVDRRALAGAVAAALARWPDGVLVESFVDGADVSVGWVEGLGVLPPIGYAYEPTGPHRILDYALKQLEPDRVRVEVPAALGRDVLARLEDAAARAFDALSVTGFGRADFRVTPNGDVVFLEMNPLPTLAPTDEDLYAAAACLGRPPRDLVAAIVDAAARPAAPFDQPSRATA